MYVRAGPRARTFFDPRAVRTAHGGVGAVVRSGGPAFHQRLTTLYSPCDTRTVRELSCAAAEPELIAGIGRSFAEDGAGVAEQGSRCRRRWMATWTAPTPSSTAPRSRRSARARSSASASSVRLHCQQTTVTTSACAVPELLRAPTAHTLTEALTLPPDFPQFQAGPAAAVLLADYGADVCKIEPPVRPTSLLHLRSRESLSPF